MAETVNTIGDLIHDRSNPRKHNQRNLKVIVDSLHDVGFARSIVIDENNEILAGNGVTEAAAIAGIERVIEVEADGNTIIAVRRRGLTDEQKQRLKYLDNRSGELAEWDAEQLLADMSAGLDLSSMFRDDELDALLADLQPKPGPVDDAGAQIDKAEELRQKWGVELGQMWQLGEHHQLICGDCTDADVVARLMGGEKADCVVTDPPYGVDKAEWDSEFPTAWIDICWLYSDRMLVTPGNTYLIVAANKIGRYKDLIALHATNGMTKSVIAFGNWTPVLACGEWKWEARQNYLGYSVTLTEDIAHPSPKPLRGWTLLVENYTKPDTIVLDPFCGSGTTIIACEQLGRKCRAAEISAGYVAVALERYSTSTNKMPVLVE